jgi:hypothetical protein
MCAPPPIPGFGAVGIALGVRDAFGSGRGLRPVGPGQREDAVAAIEEAITIRREAAAARPTVFAARLNRP